MELLKELCETSGIPGFEERLRAIVRRELEPVVDEMRVDALGNLICVKKKSGAPKLMIAAHMDEIGYVVNFVEEKTGLLRFVGLGGHDPRNMVAQHVTVCAPDGDLTGVLYPGIKPPHIQTDADRNTKPQLTDYFIDLGLPTEEVERLVPIGTPVTIQRTFKTIGECVSCKAMDDRVALYVMIRAMQAAESFGFETYAVATVQEEVGLRGAGTSAFDVQPDVGIAIDITLAADIPGVPKHERVTELGGGTAIKIMDSSAVSNPKLVQYLKDLADARNILWQPEILPRGGTDAGAMQRIRGGAPVCTISIPTRYVHSSVEMAHRGDIDASVALMTAFIEEGHRGDFVLV